MTFLLIIGGAFELVTATGVLAALCKKMSLVFRGSKKYLVIPIFLCMFALFGTTMGMSTEVAVFVPIGITLALSLGLDKVTGTAMIAMGAASGFTADLLNPFNVGVAQGIAELPLYSGMGMRFALLAVLLIADTVYIIAYAKQVEKDPTRSIIYGEPDDGEFAPLEGDNAVKYGALILAGTCLELIEKPELLAEIKAEFTQTKASENL